MSSHLFALLLAGGSPQGASPEDAKRAMLTQFGMIAFVFVVLYLTMIRPQSKKAKQQAELLKTLKAGDRVSTAAGILGVVTAVRDDSVTLRSADSKIEVQKSAVQTILERAS